MLIFDGHDNHVSIRIVQEAMKNNIELIRLPRSHTTFGQICFWTYQNQMGQKGRAWEKMGNNSSRLSKKQFTELLSQVLQEAGIRQNVKKV